MASNLSRNAIKGLNNPMRNTTSQFGIDRKNNSISPIPFEQSGSDSRKLTNLKSLKQGNASGFKNPR